jgi:hypothetical protein
LRRKITVFYTEVGERKFSPPTIIGTYLSKYMASNFRRRMKKSAFCTKISDVWGVTMCSPVKAHPRFGETCCLYLQGSRAARAWKEVALM